MKGTFFQKPLEYNLEVTGESWSQGDNVKGELIIKNHDSSKLDISNIGCHLCFVDIKKMKAKNEKAFTFIESIVCSENDKLSSDEPVELKFDFKLKSDCQITDTGSSLYILCGDKNAPFEGGLLQLNIKPVKAILGFVETFENFFRFKFKPFKNKKDAIEAKVVAPTSKEWSSIQQINLKMRMVDSSLELSYLFKVKKISYDSAVMETKDTKIEIKKTLTKKEHSMFGDMPNQDGIMKSINEVLEEVKVKPLV